MLGERSRGVRVSVWVSVRPRSRRFAAGHPQDCSSTDRRIFLRPAGRSVAPGGCTRTVVDVAFIDVPAITPAYPDRPGLRRELSILREQVLNRLRVVRSAPELSELTADEPICRDSSLHHVVSTLLINVSPDTATDNDVRLRGLNDLASSHLAPVAQRAVAMYLEDLASAS
jgi:hypothetical protein